MHIRKRKQPRTSTVLLFALIIFILGIYLIGYNYLASKKNKVYTSMNLLLYNDEIPDKIDDTDESKNLVSESQAVDEKKDNIKPTITYNYIGTIEIPKIQLKKGFLDVNSPYNTVSRNVTVINQSTFPDQDKNNLILAAHSGNCTVCYFDKLYTLSNGDKAIVTYKNKKYIYKQVNMYNVPKTGQVEIRRSPEKNVLTLITCTHDSDTEQTVHIFELSSVENK